MKGAVAIALIFPGLMAWLYFVVLANDGAAPNPALMTTISLGKGLQFILPLIAVWLWDRSSLRLAKPTTSGLMLGILFGRAVATAIVALYFGWLKHLDLAAHTPEKVRGKVREFHLDTVPGFIALAIGISIVHSLLEEYYWRWFVFGQLRRWLPLALAIMISSLGFMLHHIVVLSVYFPGTAAFWLLVMPFSFGVAVGGGFWAWLYARSGSLYAAWASHCLIDAAIMVVGFDMIFEM